VRSLRILCVGVVLVTCGHVQGARAQSISGDAPTLLGGAGDAIEEQVEPFDPEQPRTEQQRDRLEALSLFAAGRMLEHQGDAAGALRLYQRALRQDPRALPVLRQIIPLAQQLGRSGELVNYAQKLAELNADDPALLEAVAEFLTQRGEFEAAIQLFSKARELQPKRKSSGYVKLTDRLARLYFASEQFDLAADSFFEVTEALKSPEENGLSKSDVATLQREGQIYELAAEAHLKVEKPARALAAFRKLNDLAPDGKRLAIHVARVRLAQHRGDAALAQLERYFEGGTRSEGAAAYELLAQVLAELGREDELLTRLDALHAETPNDAPLGFYLADRYREENKLAAAEAAYKRLARGDTRLRAERGLVEIYRETLQVDELRGVLGGVADESFSRAVQLYRRTGRAELLLAVLRAVTEEEVASSDNDAAEEPDWVEPFLAAAERQREEDAEQLDFGADLAVALVAIDAGRYAEANTFFELALEANRREAGSLLLAWGLGLLFDEQYVLAVDVFQRGIDDRIVPLNSPDLYYYQAGALEMVDRTDDALRAARKAASLAVESAQVHSRIPWILYHAGRYEAAADAYREMVARFENDYGTEANRDVLRDARLALSNICVTLERLDEAEEWLEQVLDEFPEDVSALNDLGYLWADRGKNLARALRMVRKAVEAEPENVAYLDSLGWALYRLERFDEAVEQLEKALETAAQQGEEPDGVILDHLGDAYHAAGREIKARATWRQALEALERAEEAKLADAVRSKLDAEDSDANKSGRAKFGTGSRPVAVE